MSQSSRMFLTVFINLLLIIASTSLLYVLESNWQAKKNQESRDRTYEFYFNKVEHYLDNVANTLNFISEEYSEGSCSRPFILDMRKKLFNIPGAIELGIVQTIGDQGVIACSSWGESGHKIFVRKPSPHDGILLTGPHLINSLEMPVYVIKKTVENFEFNILIKQKSVDNFIMNSREIAVSIADGTSGEKYRDSNIITDLSYVIPTNHNVQKHSLYFIPGSLLMFIICFFLISPKFVRLIEKYILRFKIKNHYYYNEYQPIVDTKNQTIFSIEVFLRVKNNSSIQENIENIKDLDLCVDHSLFQIDKIWKSFDRDFIQQHSFQVNISSRHLESLVFIKELLRLDPLQRESLILEVTENESLMIDKNLMKSRMTRLKSHGFRFAIDDFGVEYSSLSYISEFDFDILKTDKMFIEDTSINNAVLKAVINLAHEVGMVCIAEGVEKAEDKIKLCEMGVYLHQGWYYGRSMSAENIVDFKV